MADEAKPTFDRVITREAAETYLASKKARLVQQGRGRQVYTLGSGAQVLVEAAGAGRARVRVYAGKCPCDGR